MDPFYHHPREIAKRTLRMPDAMVGVMGGMTKEQAREVLKRAGWSSEKIVKWEHD